MCSWWVPLRVSCNVTSHGHSPADDASPPTIRFTVEPSLFSGDGRRLPAAAAAAAASRG